MFLPLFLCTTDSSSSSTCMAINVVIVQYNGGLLSDIILLALFHATTCEYPNGFSWVPR